MAKNETPPDAQQAPEAPADVSEPTRMRTFSSLTPPDDAASGTLLRTLSNGTTEKCRILNGTEWLERLPVDTFGADTIQALWGGGRYRVMWHNDKNKAAGRSAETAFEGEPKPADFRPPKARPPAPPEPPRLTVRPLPPVPVGVPADVALAFFVQAEERAEAKSHERERALERSHERAMDREAARHAQHMQVTQQGFQFLLAAATQAAAQPPGPPIIATDPRIVRALTKIDQRLDEIEIPDDGGEDPTTPTERMLDKYLPAGIAALQEIVKMAAARRTPVEGRTVHRNPPPPPGPPPAPVEADFRPDPPPPEAETNSWGASS